MLLVVVCFLLKAKNIPVNKYVGQYSLFTTTLMTNTSPTYVLMNVWQACEAYVYLISIYNCCFCSFCCYCGYFQQGKFSYFFPNLCVIFLILDTKKLILVKATLTEWYIVTIQRGPKIMKHF